MKVVVDCRGVSRIEDGLSIYILNLVESLPVVAPEIQFVLVTRRPEEIHPRILKLASQRGLQTIVLPAQFMRPAQHWRIPHLLWRVQADVFHYPHFDLPLLTGIPSVITMTDVNYFTIPKYFHRSRLAAARRVYSMGACLAACSKAREILAISEHTAESLRAIVGPRTRAKISVTPCAVDFRLQREAEETAGERVRLEEQLRADPYAGWGRYLLYVGVDRYHKNLERVIRAFHAAGHNGHEQWRLFLVGRMHTSSESKIDRLSRELGLENRIVRLGYVSRRSLIELYKRAGGLLLCSLNEGFGLPVLEAMNFGVPVITSRQGATKEVAADAAILADPLSIEEIAAAIRRLRREPDLRRELARRGRRRAGEYSWIDSARATVEAYRRAAAGPRRCDRRSDPATAAIT